MDTKQGIEKILGSRNRIKILSLLSQNGPSNISKIADTVGLNYTATLRHLELLKNSDLVKEYSYGKIRIFETVFSSLELSFIDEIGLVLEITELETYKNKVETKTDIYKVFQKPLIGSTLRNKVKSRDNNKCVICGLNELDHINKYDASLTIHHIDYNRYNNIENNLITLCKTCHVKTHKSKYKDNLKEEILKHIDKLYNK